MRALLAALLCVVVVACGSTTSTVGSVIDIDGDLTGVDSFTIRTRDGETLTFVPQERLLFDGGPLSHLTDHLRSGELVEVVFERQGDDLVAVRVGDAG